MDTTVFLIRHGDIVYPTDDQGRKLVYGPDVPLSDSGRAGIRSFANRLLRETHRLDRIYTSPFRRAIETATIVSSTLHLPDPIIVDEFRDIDAAQNIGRLLDDILNGKFVEGYGETHVGVSERMLHGIQTVVEKEKGHAVGIVSHGDPIRVALYRLMNPENQLPSIRELVQYEYLGKGEAWRLVLTPTLDVIDREYIGRPIEQYGRGERKS